jgi:hypothetical protein
MDRPPVLMVQRNQANVKCLRRWRRLILLFSWGFEDKPLGEDGGFSDGGMVVLATVDSEVFVLLS